MSAIKHGEGLLGTSPMVVPSPYYNAAGGNFNAQQWSLSCWVYGSDSGSYSGEQILQIAYDDGGWIRLRQYRKTPRWLVECGGSWSGATSADATQQGWCHVGWTFDATSGSTIISRLYVNGSLVCTLNTPVAVGSAEPTELRIGPQTLAPGNSIQYRWLIVWDDGSFDDTEFGAIHALGVNGWQFPARDLPDFSPATITFLASMMHGPDADYAAAGDTPIQDAGTGDPGGWAWVALGPDEDDKYLHFLGGEPAHDGSPDDPVPPWCGLVMGERYATRPSEIRVAQAWSDIITVSDSTYLRGLYFDSVKQKLMSIDANNDPTNLWVRARVHVFAGATYEYNPATEVWEPTGTTETTPGATTRSYVSLGAVAYKPERVIEADTDAGTDATHIVISEASAYADGYLNGAYVCILDPSVGCFGEQQQIASHVGNTLTLGGSFSVSPGTGTRVAVHDGGVMLPNLEAAVRNQRVGLRAEHAGFGIRRPVGVEGIFHAHQRGYMRASGKGWRLSAPEYYPPLEEGIGPAPRSDGEAGQDLWQIGFQSLEVFSANAPRTRLRELYDNFLCTPATYQDSPSRRIYRYENVERIWNTPNREGAQLSDFIEDGTWRHAHPWAMSMSWDDKDQCLKGVLRAEDNAGNVAYGYIRATWDDGTKTWTVVDDSDVTNPFLTQDELDEWFQSATDNWWASGCRLQSMHQAPDGTWFGVLYVYGDGEDYNDSAFVYGNPGWESLDDIDLSKAVLRETPRTSAEPMVQPLGHGGLVEDIPNRDAQFYLGRNQFAPPGSGRTWYATGRAQQHLHNGGELFQDAQRRLISFETEDGCSLSGLPMQHTLIGPMDHVYQMHYPSPVCLSDEIRCVSSDLSFQNNLHLFWTDCGWYRAWEVLIADNGSPPEGAAGYATVFHSLTPSHHIVMYCIWPYENTLDTDWGTIWWDRGREAHVELTGTDTSGWFVTPVLLKPVDGWEELMLNIALGDGEVTVAVLDPENMEQPISGYDHTDCDTVANGTHASPSEVTWGGNSLSELDAHEHLRLEFRLTRPAGGDESPKLYEWWAGASQDEYTVTYPETPAPPMTCSSDAPGVW